MDPGRAKRDPGEIRGGFPGLRGARRRSIRATKWPASVSAVSGSLGLVVAPAARISGGMAKKYPKPIFKPRELRKRDASEWYVEAEWPDGTLEPIGSFQSDSDARDWIASKSGGWLEKRNP